MNDVIFPNQIYEIDLLVKYGIHHLYNKQTNKQQEREYKKRKLERRRRIP